MPTYNENTVSNKKFKKTNVRSWDQNLVDLLKIKEEPRIDLSTNESAKNNKNNHMNNNSYDGISIPEFNKVQIGDNESSKPEFNKVQPEVNEGSKPEFNKVQPEVNESSEPEFNKVQPEVNESSEPEFNKVQPEVNESSEPEFNKVQPEVNESSEPEFNKVQQSRFNSEPTSLPFLNKENDIGQHIRKLSLTEFNVLKLIIDICSQINALETGCIPSRDFDNHLKINRNTRETALKRLCKKELISRKKGKGGPSGYINISITKKTIESFNREKVNLNKFNFQKMDIENNQGSKTEFNNAIYSNSNITTNLPDEWKDLDIEPLKHIGFTITQIRQLIQKNHPDVVQESIYHFAYGLQHSEKTKSYNSPLNVLMGVLSKGGAWGEPGYKSPQELAMEQHLEQKKKEKQRIENLKNELFNVDFDIWFNSLTSDEKQSIFIGFKLPPKIQQSMPEEKAMDLYKDYFKNKIWNDKEAAN